MASQGNLITPVPLIEELSTTIDDALKLVSDFSSAHDVSLSEEYSPESLVEQCMELCAYEEDVAPEPIRTIHHFACTGGTLITKCISAMPNTQVLSEVDPLSTLMDELWKPRFTPSDMVSLARHSTRGASQELLVDLFLNNIETMYKNFVQLGQRLILRDHSHSHYCTGAEVAERPSLRSIVADKFNTLSVVTVRHPIDSFLSLEAMSSLHFTPPTFDEYCNRYIKFLREYDGIEIIRYEDFVSAPDEMMSKMCEILDLPFLKQFVYLFNVFKLSGDSGRSSGEIMARPRRPLRENLRKEIGESLHYRKLRLILNYD